jgi:hypothetical protein
MSFGMIELADRRFPSYMRYLDTGFLDEAEMTLDKAKHLQERVSCL